MHGCVVGEGGRMTCELCEGLEECVGDGWIPIVRNVI